MLSIPHLTDVRIVTISRIAAVTTEYKIGERQGAIALPLNFSKPFSDSLQYTGEGQNSFTKDVFG